MKNIIENIINVNRDFINLCNTDKLRQMLSVPTPAGMKFPLNRFSLWEYAEETGNLKNFSNALTPSEFFKDVQEASDIYANWCLSIDGDCSKYANDLKNYFVGAIGEYFYYFILTDVKTLWAVRDGDRFERVDFNYVTPHPIKDFGLDMVAVVNDCGAGIQCKFMSDKSNNKLNINSVLDKLYRQSACNGFIAPQGKNNLMLMVLEDEKKLYRQIADDGNADECIIIGNSALNECLGGRYKIFWDRFFASFSDIDKLFVDLS